MATHDYVIANGTGAAVRTDLNNALAAIVSNNSSSSSPSTTYAYQWWADTSNNVLKIRNSANNAWVELLQLDGTLTLEDGSAASPALGFRDNLNTGIFSGSANEFNISTAGTERFVINSAGNCGIGTQSPAQRLHIQSAADCVLRVTSADGNAAFLDLGDVSDPDGGRIHYDSGSNLVFNTVSSERMRIDSSGRLLLGHSAVTPVDNDANNPHFQVQGTGADDSRISIRHNSTTASNAASIYLSRSRGTSAASKTSVASGDALGSLIFMGADGTHDTRAAIIQASCDGTPGDNDMPGRLEFFTTPDGALNSVERMRITSAGNVGVGQTVPQAFNHGSSGITTTKFEVQASTASASTFETATFRAGNDANGAAARLRIVHDNDRGLVITGGRSSNAAFGSFSMTDQNGGIISSVHIDNNGTWFWNKTSQSSATPGVELYKDGPNFMTRAANGGTVLGLNDSTGTNGDIMRFYYQDVHRGSLNFNGSNFAAVNASDYRLKENDTPISDGITRVKQLRPIRFNWKTDSSTIHDGFFAHEVQNVVPAAVIGEKDSTIGSRGEGYQMMSNEPLIPLLTAAIKELIVKVEALESA